MVKNLSAVQEITGDAGCPLGQEDPLEMEKATHSSILAWEIPWIEATVHGVAEELDTTEHAHTHATDSSVGPGKGLVSWQKQL